MKLKESLKGWGIRIGETKGQEHHKNRVYRINWLDSCELTEIRAPVWAWPKYSVYMLWLCSSVLVIILGAGAVSDSFVCLWDFFPPTGMPHPALMWEYVPGPIYSHINMPYLVDVPDSEGRLEVGVGGSGRKRRWGREGKLQSDVIYERRIN